MSRALIERRLTELTDRLRQLREELVVADEQHRHFADDADEARIRSLVSETPLADRTYVEAQRHAEAASKHRQELADQVAKLEHSQDELLDRLLAER